ncbi:cellulose-binding protein [Vibrio ostreicida]|nr:cellulose-binding protein [Vibrio ostreicida]
MIYGGLLLIIVLTLGNAFYLSEQIESHLIKEELHQARQTLLSLNQTVSVSLHHIEKMRSAITSAIETPILAQDKATLEFINGSAAKSPAWAPWENLPDELKTKIGQIFLQSKPKDISTEVLTLLTMMPAVSVTHQRYPEFQWSYYYSADKHLTLLYPWLSQADILAATNSTTMDDAIEIIFEAGGTYPLQLVGSENNTDRQNVWTTPYMDAGGKGMMVSLLAPIYEKDTFVGAVGTDITLKVLDSILNKKADNISQMLLIDSGGLVVGDSNGGLKHKTDTVLHQDVATITKLELIQQANEGVFLKTPQGYWASYSLKHTPWNLVIELPNSNIRHHIIQAILPYLLMGGVFSILLVFVVLYQHWNFSQPALQLAKFVEELPNNKEVTIPAIPEKWTYWFTNAAKAETDRREYLNTINQQNQELEKRVAERTQELQQALEVLKTTQDELIQSEKLAGLGSLVAGVAHELNTPIGNALMVSTTLKDLNQSFALSLESGLRRSVLDRYLDQSNESAESMTRNLHRAAELISSFKQVAVDQSSYQRRTFDLPEILHELRVTMAPSLSHNQIQLEETLSTTIMMDSYPGPLTQVLMNLLSNAVIHAFADQQQRKITIECAFIEPDSASISVSDNGHGIAEEHLPKLFDPFFTTRLGQGGSGLGLNIVYNIVTGLLGGDIRVTSTLNSGTCFTLIIPLKAPNDES